MRPYPVDRLRRLTRERAEALTRWARSAPIAALVSRGRDAKPWLGAPLEVTLDAAVEWTDDAPPGEGAWVLLDGPRPAGLALSAEIASALVERTLGAEEAIGARGPMGEVERGVLAYAIARWLGPGPWAVAAVFTRSPALVEALGPRMVWPIALTLGEARGRGALWLPEPRGVAPAPSREPPPWLPIVLRADAGRATLPTSEVVALEVGDVVIPDRLDLELLHLRAPGGARTWVCRAADALVLDHVLDHALPTTRARRRPAKEEKMTDSTIAKMGDTPITLHVEVARVETTLAELAGLSPGEVLRTGRTLGEQVTLRAGERAVARGELVDVDGELGVQITEIVSGA